MAQTMKAAVWHAKKDIRVEEVPSHLRCIEKSEIQAS